MMVSLDIGFGCVAMDAIECAANELGVCTDCDDASNAATCIDDDGAPTAGCQISHSFIDSLPLSDGSEYASASCGLKGTEEECIETSTDGTTGEEEPSNCEWSTDTCTPTAEFSSTIAALWAVAFTDCSEPDACTCSAEDTQLMQQSQTMEGMSGGCMACVMSAAAADDQTAFYACISAGYDCADACICSSDDAQLIMSGTNDGLSDGCYACMLFAGGDESSEAACVTAAPCLETDQTAFDELTACAENDPDGDISPTTCAMTLQQSFSENSSSTCQFCVRMTFQGLGFDPDNPDVTDEMFAAIQ